LPLAAVPAGWRGASATPSVFANFTGDALEAHKLCAVEVRHPVEVAGNERAHLQQWLTKRCGYEVSA
jgi:anti-sigma factor RsiW